MPNEATTRMLNETAPSNTFKATLNIEPFRPSMNWLNWIRRLKGDFKLFQVKDVDYAPGLLHYIGHEAFDVICDKCSPDDSYNKSFEEIIQILQEFYAPKPLEIAENYRFHQRNQMEGESLQDYVVAIQKLAINCNFGEYLKTALRNKFVFGLKSNRIRCRLLEMDKLTFDDAVKIAHAMEMSEKDANKEILNTSMNYVTLREKKKGGTKNTSRTSSILEESTKTKKLQSIQPKFTSRNSNSNIKYYRCGGNHLASNCQLPKNTKCRFCGTLGHIQKVCFKRINNSNEIGAVPTHQVEAEEEINQLDHTHFRDKYTISLNISGKWIKFEIDSGSAVTVMSKLQFKKMFPNTTINSTVTKLFTFCNTEVTTEGYANVIVNHKNQQYNLNIYLTDTNKMPLLGREWIRQLQLLKLDTLHTIDVHKEEIDSRVQFLLEKYNSITETKLAKITGIQARLTLKSNTVPVYIKARPIPFKLKQLVENEIDKLVEEGVLIKVNTSDWATPIVPILKSNNTVRICGDFKVTLNPHLIVDDHPLPTTDELFATMAGGKKFTKIDLKQAYLQLELRPEDQHLLTINTHKGLFQCTRLLFGIASAPAIWQREMENILNGIPGVSVFLDDIRITGPDDLIHIQRLEEVLKRLHKYNIKINTDKCEFFKKEINYCGYKIDEKGIHKCKNKIDAIDKMPRPANKSELRSFIGMINYYGKFIKNLSTILYPLNQLLRENVSFTWSKECEEAYLLAKEEFKSDTILAHYDSNLPLTVATDASSYGVGAVLSQIQPDGSERVIQYASQTLNDTQKKYSQIDKEAYEKFLQHLEYPKFFNNIIHKRIAPFNPATNGQVERFVQSLKKSLVSLNIDSQNTDELDDNRTWKRHINQIIKLPLNDNQKVHFDTVFSRNNVPPSNQVDNYNSPMLTPGIPDGRTLPRFPNSNNHNVPNETRQVSEVTNVTFSQDIVTSPEPTPVVSQPSIPQIVAETRPKRWNRGCLPRRLLDFEVGK
ncbi:uncharacterized protein K02A2.6-like [Zophobas morio]|uniref:uncharacterized protein K02A2.6-like n=1 Tax=Zophobas morio TaxID=2755281 RepID=UPI0030833F19